MAARLKETYVNEAAPALMKKFEYKRSCMLAPKVSFFGCSTLPSFRNKQFCLGTSLRTNGEWVTIIMFILLIFLPSI